MTAPTPSVSPETPTLTLCPSCRTVAGCKLAGYCQRYDTSPDPVAASPVGAERERTRDCLADRTDVGLGYWQARSLLARTFPTHPRLDHVGKDELRDTLSACADAFAAFVLQHPPATSSAALREAAHAFMRAWTCGKADSPAVEQAVGVLRYALRYRFDDAKVSEGIAKVDELLCAALATEGT